MGGSLTSVSDFHICVVVIQKTFHFSVGTVETRWDRKGEKKKNRSWKRKLGLERLLLPEYRRDDGGLNVKLCSPAEPIRTEGPGNVCKLLVPSSLEFMYWHWTDPFYTQRPARGAPTPSRGWMRWDGWSGQSRLGEQTGILPMQLRRLSNPNPLQAAA